MWQKPSGWLSLAIISMVFQSFLQGGHLKGALFARCNIWCLLKTDEHGYEGAAPPSMYWRSQVQSLQRCKEGACGPLDRFLRDKGFPRGTYIRHPRRRLHNPRCGHQRLGIKEVKWRGWDFPGEAAGGGTSSHSADQETEAQREHWPDEMCTGMQDGGLGLDLVPGHHPA